MNRLRTGFLILLLAGMAQLAPAADPPVGGNWKIAFSVPSQQGEIPIDVLISFSQSKGKWVGDVLDVSPKLNVEPLITDVAIGEDTLKFDMPFGGQKFSFDGRFAKDGKKIKGSFIAIGKPILLDMYPSKLKDFKDEFAMVKEVLDQQEGAPFFNALIPVLKQAEKQKLKAEEVRGYADRALKEAEAYGPRWQRGMALGIASALVDQPPFAPIALEQARQAERMLSDRDDVGTTITVLEILANALKKNGKADESKKIDLQLAKAESRDYADFIKTSALKGEPYAGRKAKGDRVVLVELFTGCDSPPCVAADLAFEALGRQYKPSEVVLMEYDIHFNGPDPMTVPDNMKRAEFYKISGNEPPPRIYLGGKSGGEVAGTTKAAAVKNKSLRELIDEQLEKPAGAKLTLTGGLKAGEISLSATVDGVKTPGPNVVLRIALTEERIRYAGGNGQRYHDAVVRAFLGPNGVKGYPITKNGTEQSVKLKLDDLRASLNKYLDDVAKEAMDDFSDRPLRLKNLKAIAFVQDDTTGEVLQAVQIDLEEK